MPKTERAADAQLSRCRLLAEAVTFASKALEHAGARLQHGSAGFRPSDAGDMNLAHACYGLVAACGGLGTHLTLLATALSEEILEPLQQLQRAIEEDRSKRRAQLIALEQAEAECAKSAGECARRREKAAEALRTLKQESAEVERAGWFFRKTLSGKLKKQVEKGTHVENKAVQELAQHVEAWEAASLRKKTGADSFQEIISEADARLRIALHPLLLKCSSAWKETAAGISDIASKLQADAAALHKQDTQVDGDAVDQDSDVSSSNSEDDSPVHGGVTAEAPLLSTQYLEAGADFNLEPMSIGKSMHETPDKGSTCRNVSEQMTADQKPGDKSNNMATEAPRFSKLVPDAASEGSPSASSSGGSSPRDGRPSIAGQRVIAAEPTAEASQAVSIATRQVHQGAAESAPFPEKSKYFEFVAGVKQGPLGLKLSWPPGRVMVKELVPGGWAETCGIRVDSEILAANGDLVLPMQEADFREILKQRPLCLALNLPSSSGSAPSQALPASAAQILTSSLAVDRPPIAAPPSVSPSPPDSVAGDRQLQNHSDGDSPESGDKMSRHALINRV
jgi:hypothetical protein